VRKIQDKEITIMKKSELIRELELIPGDPEVTDIDGNPVRSAELSEVEDSRGRTVDGVVIEFR
jgi:hypothetical protein